MKEKITQVIVVEGRDDTANLKRYFDVETYETRGSAINEQDLERIQRLHQRHGVIVFTDSFPIKVRICKDNHPMTLV